MTWHGDVRDGAFFPWESSALAGFQRPDSGHPLQPPPLGRFSIFGATPSHDAGQVALYAPYCDGVLREAWLAVVRLLGPIAPHIGEELWAALGGEGPLYRAPWPGVDESARVRSQVTLVVQINGKLRAPL